MRCAKARSRSFRTDLTLSFLFGLLWSGDASPLPTYTVRGLIREECWLGQSEWSTRIYRLTVGVDGDRWSIELVPESFPVVSSRIGTNIVESFAPDYIKATCDGTHFYQVSSYESQHRAKPQTKNAGEAIIGAGCVPSLADERIVGIWYAFASSSYLQRITDGLIEPVERFPASAYRLDRPRVGAFWRLSADLPHLPQTLLMTNYCLLSGKVTNVEGSRTNFILETVDFTNVAGLQMPRNVHLEYYSCTGQGRPWLLRRRIAIEATLVRPGFARESDIPELPVPSFVADQRFLMSNPPAIPVLLSSNWPTGEALGTAYSKLKRIVPKRSRTEFHIRLLLLVALVTPPTYFAFRQFQRRRKESQRRIIHKER